MTSPIRKRAKAFFRSPIISPAGLAARALLIVIAFLILQAAGLREYTSFISGTSPTGDPLTTWPLVLGGVYLLTFLAGIVMVPTFLLGAVFLWCLQRLMRKRAQPFGQDAKSV